MTHLGLNIEKLTTLFNDRNGASITETAVGDTTVIWDKYIENKANPKNNTPTQNTDNSNEGAPVNMEEIYKTASGHVMKIRKEGNEKFANIDKARKEPTSNGLTYDEAIKILDEMPRAGFGVMRDEKSGQLRQPTLDEIYNFCKENPDNEQAKSVMERIDRAREAKNEIESKYPEILSKEYQMYYMYNSTNEFGV